MIVTPMTMIIVVVMALLALGGAAILRRSVRGSRQEGEPRGCAQCQALNPVGARYCSRCGQALE